MVCVSDLNNIVDIRVLIAFVVVKIHVIDIRFRRAPMDVKVEHFIEWSLGEVSVRIVQKIATSLHGCFAEMDTMFVFHRVRPAAIFVRGIRGNVSKYGAAMAFPFFASSPDIIDQFVVVEGEIAGDIPVPLCEFDASTQVQLVVFPAPTTVGMILTGTGKADSPMESRQASAGCVRNSSYSQSPFMM